MDIVLELMCILVQKNAQGIVNAVSAHIESDSTCSTCVYSGHSAANLLPESLSSCFLFCFLFWQQVW